MTSSLIKLQLNVWSNLYVPRSIDWTPTSIKRTPIAYFFLQLWHTSSLQLIRSIELLIKPFFARFDLTKPNFFWSKHIVRFFSRLRNAQTLTLFLNHLTTSILQQPKTSFTLSKSILFHNFNITITKPKSQNIKKIKLKSLTHTYNNHNTFNINNQYNFNTIYKLSHNWYYRNITFTSLTSSKQQL
jgi:hypothetical protein